MRFLHGGARERPGRCSVSCPTGQITRSLVLLPVPLRHIFWKTTMLTNILLVLAVLWMVCANFMLML